MSSQKPKKQTFAKFQGTGDVPPSLEGSSGVLYEDEIYLFGGKSGSCTNQIFKFSLEGKTHPWTELAIAGISPSPRKDAATVLDGDTMYLFGGSDGSDGLSDFYTFSFKTHTWKQLIPISTTKQGLVERFNYQIYGHSAVLYNGAIYYFGGRDKNKEATAQLYKYDIQSKVFTEISTKASPPPRWYHSAVVHNDKMIIFGGRTGTVVYNDLWEFTFKPPTWKQISTVPGKGLEEKPPPRHSHTALVHNGLMIMFGGIGDKETPADRKGHQYDIAIHTWKILRKDDPPIIPERSEHVALYNNGTMYIVGGKTSPSDQCDVWMFPISDELPLVTAISGTAKDGDACLYGMKKIAHRVHSAIVKARMPSLRMYLQPYNEAEAKQGEGESPSSSVSYLPLSEAALNALIHFIYYDSLPDEELTYDDATELIKLADVFGSHSLKKEVAPTFDRLNLTRFSDLKSALNVAYQFGLSQLEGKAVHHLAELIPFSLRLFEKEHFSEETTRYYAVKLGGLLGAQKTKDINEEAASLFALFKDNLGNIENFLTDSK